MPALSLAVLFKEPKYEIMRTFSLSGMTIYVNRVPRRYCHVYVMESINEEKINRFVSILKEDGAFPEQNHENGLSPCMYATSE